VKVISSFIIVVEIIFIIALLSYLIYQVVGYSSRRAKKRGRSKFPGRIKFPGVGGIFGGTRPKPRGGRPRPRPAGPKAPSASPVPPGAKPKQPSAKPLTPKPKPKSPSGRPAKWWGPGEGVRVQGYSIADGMIYVGESLPDLSGRDNDACLIDPSLQVSPAEPWYGGDEVGDRPRYADMPPRCRGAYLKWLATGRSDSEANIGYVFLFFYGLERRLFVDGQNGLLSPSESAKIAQEINRLLMIYGGNRAFRGHAKRLLAMEWALYRGDQPVPDYLDFNDRYCLQPFQVVLARQVASGRPIPAEMALQWMTLHPEFGQKTPARRCAKEFKELFSIRYKRRFGDGLIVKPNKTPLELESRFANPSLDGDLKLRVPDLPNPFILTAPLNRLKPLIEECTDDLEPYSRFLGRKDNDPNSLAALGLLPQDIKHLSPAINRARSLLTQLCSSGAGLVYVADLYRLFGDKPPQQIDKKESENLATLVEAIGFGIAPDVRFHDLKLNPDGKVVVFPNGYGADFRPSAVFLTLVTIIRLGALVSQTDDVLSDEEKAILQNLINETGELTQSERDSLHAFLQWCLDTPQGTVGIKQRLSEANPAEKAAIGRVLVAIAIADGTINPTEILHLEKLYTIIGLDKEQVRNDVNALAAARGPLTVGLPDAEPTFPSSAGPTFDVESAKPDSFSLDKELIGIILEETRQVKILLTGIFADPEEEPAASDVALTALASDNPLTLLDQAHQDLFHRLSQQETWERSSVEALCKELGLMADGAMEVLNEWSIKHASAPLIDDGDPIYVDTNLATEIVNVQ